MPEAARRIAEREPRRPSSFDPRLGGDVETIALKALEKDKERRYASAGELADDLRRALGDEPILARSHSTFYRLRKAVRRHRGLSTALLGLFVALIAFAVVASVQARRLQRELTRSQLERGALLTRSGALEAAESLLWPLLLAEPESEEALWALRNLYHRFPCLATRRDSETNVPRVGNTTRSLLAHPDGQRLIGVTPEGQLRTYRLDTLEKQVIGPGQEFGWNNIALSREAGLLFHLGSHLDLYELDSLEQLARFEGSQFRGYGLAVLPGGRSVLLGSEDGCLREFDVDAWGLVREVPLHHSTVTAIDLAPDGRIATLDTQGVLCLLDGLDTPPARVVRALGGQAEEVRFSPDGCRVATAGKNLIRVWDSGTGDLLERARGAERRLAPGPVPGGRAEPGRRGMVVARPLGPRGGPTRPAHRTADRLVRRARTRSAVGRRARPRPAALETRGDPRAARPPRAGTGAGALPARRRAPWRGRRPRRLAPREPGRGDLDAGPRSPGRVLGRLEQP